jgi:hypothetical protein
MAPTVDEHRRRSLHSDALPESNALLDPDTAPACHQRFNQRYTVIPGGPVRLTA